jgi:hypothetical protein
MAGEDQRSLASRAPFAPERGEIGGPVREIVDVPGDVVGPEPARSCLAAPVGGGDPPALPPPVLERLEVFLVGVAAAGQEQQAAARRRSGLGPVDPPDRVAVRREPQAFAGTGWNGAAVEGRLVRLVRLANSALLPVVTFW